MAIMDDLTTLVCLFHHQDQAQTAIKDLLSAGVPQSSISLIGNAGSQRTELGNSSLTELEVPERDQKHLMEGVRNGGVIVAVAATSDHLVEVESVFRKHSAKKIDEAETGGHERGDTAGDVAVPVIEEELQVGKRTVDKGGVRVYRRVIEIPVEESVNLREEHVHVERRPVNRAVSDQDLAMQGDHTIELTETAEEAVISKNARVTEEVRVGKDATEHTQHIHDTVRKTEVEVEEIRPEQDHDTGRTR